MSDAPSALHKATFLGPKGENADELERLLLEVLRDHVFWRRNFHPSDPRLIDERDKRTEAYDEMAARLRDELFQILAELKRAAPTYSPRQVAHIVTDPSMPALIGYFAGMLYNQNNVVAEVSPETVREEREYFKALAHMVGYPDFLPETLSPGSRARRTPYSWGHLCSGGTVANLEMLWTARNVRLYPLAVRLVAEETERFADVAGLPVTTARGERVPLRGLSTFQLSNLPTPSITDLHLRIRSALADADPEFARSFQDALPSVRKAGLASFLLRYNDAFPSDRARLPKVFISQAAHYCWQKNMDLIGLGADALERLPVDGRIRLDTDALADRLQECRANEQPVLGVISICGTTEEGAIDPLHNIEAVRQDVAGDGLSFWHHCDAAFGGYFASMLPKDDSGDFRPLDALDDDLVGPGGLLPEDDVRAIRALARTDSITLDPHKFGFVPYPAGAVLFRNYHVRDAVSYAAPYLADDAESGFGGFLGQWTLEGSRPGAAAVSCYLSQAMVPLTPDGHGRFIRGCIEVNQKLFGALQTAFSPDNADLVLHPFHTPETVAFCFVIAPAEGLRNVEQLNSFTQRIWRRMTVDGREDINQYDFLLSKTQVNVDAYAHVLRDVLPADVVDAGAEAGASLTLLRTCLMNPFQTDWEAADEPLSEQVAAFLKRVAQEEYLEMTLAPAPEPGTDRRPVLVVEQTPHQHGGLARRMEHDERIVAHFDIRSRTAAEVRDTDDGALQAMHEVVLHVDGDAPEPMLRLARKLVDARGVDPERLLAVVPGSTAAGGVRDRLTTLGVPARHVLVEDDTPACIQRLVLKLSIGREGT